MISKLVSCGVLLLTIAVANANAAESVIPLGQECNGWKDTRCDTTNCSTLAGCFYGYNDQRNDKGFLCKCPCKDNDDCPNGETEKKKCKKFQKYDDEMYTMEMGCSGHFCQCKSVWQK